MRTSYIQRFLCQPDGILCVLTLDDLGDLACDDPVGLGRGVQLIEPARDVQSIATWIIITTTHQTKLSASVRLTEVQVPVEPPAWYLSHKCQYLSLDARYQKSRTRMGLRTLSYCRGQYHSSIVQGDR